MKMGRSLGCFLAFCCCVRAQQPAAGALVASLHQLALDPAEVYHVRDLRFSRGDFSIYLNEGVLAFTKPVGSKTICAVFTTANVDAGDAELVVAPPSRGERASLAFFAKTPNLDEHFSQAIFLFTDQMRDEALRQMEQTEIRKLPATAGPLAERWNPTVQAFAASMEVPVIESILNHDPPVQDVFYAAVAGRDLGAFQLCYNPNQKESSVLGRVGSPDGMPEFQIWTSFTPRRASPPPPEPFQTSAYTVRADVSPDLTVSAETSFHATPVRGDCRAIELEMTNRMKMLSASINGKPAEIVQPMRASDVDDSDAARLLIVAAEPLPSGVPASITIRHQGSVIRDAGEGVYFVEARNIWFPHLAFDPAKFDLTFRCPEKLRVVSSGKLVSDSVEAGTRTVHRVLDSPAQFVGFNLGDFVGADRDSAPFHVEFYANRTITERVAQAAVTQDGGKNPKAVSNELGGMADRTVELLRNYSAQWGPATTSNIAVTPIPGAFGQGFPGLIYLSINSYLPSLLRPPYIRNTLLNVFYSDILLAHEIAHQWWGNLVFPSDYRSGWLTEALANYAALQFYAEQKGSPARDELLQFFLRELMGASPAGTPVEGEGPLNVGLRLRAINQNAWRIITYDKGTWVIRMLAKRIGEKRFPEFERALIEAAKAKGLSNELLRQTAVRFLQPGDPDPTLEDFFDSWIYGVGIPKLTLSRTAANQYILRQSGVPADFGVDVPLQVESPGNPPTVQWVRSSGEGTSFSARVKGPVKLSLPAASDFLYLPE